MFVLCPWWTETYCFYTRILEWIGKLQPYYVSTLCSWASHLAILNLSQYLDWNRQWIFMGWMHDLSLSHIPHSLYGHHRYMVLGSSWFPLSHFCFAGCLLHTCYVASCQASLFPVQRTLLTSTYLEDRNLVLYQHTTRYLVLP